MLVRLQKLEELEKASDPGIFQQEKKLFLKAIRHFPHELKQQIESSLNASVTRNQLPNPETGILFETMASHLPEDFPYGRFTQVNRFIGHLILQSEIDGHALLDQHLFRGAVPHRPPTAHLCHTALVMNLLETGPTAGFNTSSDRPVTGPRRACVCGQPPPSGSGCTAPR